MSLFETLTPFLESDDLYKVGGSLPNFDMVARGPAIDALEKAGVKMSPIEGSDERAVDKASLRAKLSDDYHQFGIQALVAHGAATMAWDGGRAPRGRKPPERG